jgi:peroxiredoxin
MVSLDDAEKNRAFAEGLDARHVVLSDPLKTVAESYGVVALAGLYARRWTFYIDASGTIREIDKKVDVATAGQDIARTLERLGFPRAE